jgi:hypothetical protein
MPLITEQDFFQLTEEFLLGNPFGLMKIGFQSWVKQSFSDENQRLQLVQESINSAWQQTRDLREDEAMAKQKAIIQGCNQALTKYKQTTNTAIKHRRQLFKNAFNFLYMEHGIYEELALYVGKKATQIDYTINAQLVELTNNDRLHTQLGRSQQSYGLIGDLFCTNSPDILKKRGDHLTTQVLDAFYAVYAEDGGVIACVADGVGGHQFEEEDAMIAKVSKQGVKRTVQLFSDFLSPEALLQGLPLVADQLSEELKIAQGQESYQSTILLGVRAYPDPYTNTVRCVGINTGDCMLASWDPQTQQIQTISPAVGTFTDAENKKVTPGSLPYNYHPKYIRIIDVVLPMHVQLCLMTDGLYNGLPCQTLDEETTLSEKTLLQLTKYYSSCTKSTSIIEQSDEVKFHMTFLDDATMSELFSQNQKNSEHCLGVFVDHTIASHEASRKKHLMDAKTAEVEFESVKQQYDLLANSEENVDQEELRNLREACKKQLSLRYFTMGDDTTLGVLPVCIASPNSPRSQRAGFFSQFRQKEAIEQSQIYLSNPIKSGKR